MLRWIHATKEFLNDQSLFFTGLVNLKLSHRPHSWLQNRHEQHQAPIKTSLLKIHYSFSPLLRAIIQSLYKAPGRVESKVRDAKRKNLTWRNGRMDKKRNHKQRKPGMLLFRHWIYAGDFGKNDVLELLLHVWNRPKLFPQVHTG